MTMSPVTAAANSFAAGPRSSCKLIRVEDVAAVVICLTAPNVLEPVNTAPLLFGARPFLPREAHQRQDAAYRRVTAVYNGHSGRSADVLAAMRAPFSGANPTRTLLVRSCR